MEEDVGGKCISLVCGLPLLRRIPETVLKLSRALLPSWVVVAKSVLKRVYHKKAVIPECSLDVI